MLKQGSGEKPLWSQLYDILEDKIRNREYLVGEIVPSEKELMELYNVSRITVRKALEKLSLEGLVSRERGVGTVVIKNEDAISSSFQSSFSGVSEHANDRRVIYAKMVEAPSEVADFFKLNNNTKVLLLVRKAYIQGKESVYYESYLHPVMDIDCNKVDFSASMYQVMSNAGYRITSVKEKVSTHISSIEEMELFQRVAPFALMYRVRKAFCQDVPVELTYSKYIGENYQLEINLM